MADPSGNVGKNTYMSYDVYLNMRRSVQYYNLGLKDQAVGLVASAAQNYFTALGLNPYDVDAKTALEYMRNEGTLPDDVCVAAKNAAHAALKKCGFCRR